MTKQAAGKNLNYVWRFFGQTQRETNGKQLIFQGRETFITCVSALLLDVFFCQTLENLIALFESQESSQRRVLTPRMRLCDLLPIYIALF